MGTVAETIDADARAFIEAQHMFFVATAPASVPGAEDGHVNLSPKGLDGTLAVLDERTVCYLDLIGSGVETIAHARSDGRICLLFCAFEGLPKILRLHGRVEAIEPHQPGFEQLAAQFPKYTAARSVLRVTVQRVATSCGYGIPFYDYVGQRETLPKWGQARSAEELRAYRLEHNQLSIDGLPGIER